MKKHINRLGVRTASAVAAMIFAANAAWALEPFKVQDIRVEGLQRDGESDGRRSEADEKRTTGRACGRRDVEMHAVGHWRPSRRAMSL